MSYVSIFIVAIWLIFWVYWFLSAAKSKPTLNRGRRIKNFAGTRIIAFVLIVVLARLTSNKTNFLNDLYYNHDLLALKIIGLVIFLAGLSIAVWARINLGRNWGMPMAEKKDPELVTSGPYKYIRHPIYTGFLFGLLGTALATTFLFFFIFIFAAIYFIYSAINEEKRMTKLFPKVYDTYKHHSKMLIPFIF